MDVVELPLPAAVAVSELMGSEGCGGVGVSVKQVEACESDRVSSFVSPSIDTCNSLLSRKEPGFWKKVPDVELCRHARQLSSFHGEAVPEDVPAGSINSSPLLLPRPEAEQLQKKCNKVARSNTSCSKRSRMAQAEVSINETGADDLKVEYNELGSYPVKCNIAEKTHMPKQKNNLNGKRSDKRNGKVPKSKCDSFSLKAGLVSFSSAAGGSNLIGVYGSKPEIYDVTNHLDELSLNGLLDGSYKCPGFGKARGKKVASLNENVLHSVREACSILWLQKPIHPRNVAEIDNTYNQKISTCLVSSGASVASRSNGDEGDSLNTDLSPFDKVQDSCSNFKMPAGILDFPLYQPKDILERLALPPPKDLESLLLDVAKPAASLRNNSDLRLGKLASHRSGLPPFPWSHTSGGHCKSNSDAVKLSTSRITCQGRWVKIGNHATFLGDSAGFHADVESLTYDHSLVPSGGQKLGPSDNENAPSTSVSFASYEWGLSSPATCLISSQVPPAGHPPGLLAAAQTLYEMATHCLKQNPCGMIRWPKKPSQKAMKACKLKSNEKSEKIVAAPKPGMGSDSLVIIAEEMLPSKKLRLSVNEKNDEFSHTNTLRKGPMNWSTPRSSRSSPSKSFKDSAADTKHYNANIVKKSCMMPRAKRVLDKAYDDTQQKLRELVPMEWNRASSRLY